MKRIGFGQVEPNHLSAQRNGQIYAQRKATGLNIIENGMFLKYTVSGSDEVVSTSGVGEWMLVLNEVKLYDDAWRYMQTVEGVDAGVYSGYAMKPDNQDDMVPRLFKTNVGDIFTTNTIGAINGKEVDPLTLAVGNTLKIGTDGYLYEANAEGATFDSTSTMEWTVVRVYTMPDGQAGVKIQRTK